MGGRATLSVLYPQTGIVALVKPHKLLEIASLGRLWWELIKDAINCNQFNGREERPQTTRITRSSCCTSFTCFNCRFDCTRKRILIS